MNKYSLIIPSFNEGESLPNLIKSCEELTKKHHNVEIIIVNNGSSDNSLEILDKYTKSIPNVNFITLNKNRGYGNGIKYGLLKAKGDIVGWTHADLQTDPADIIKSFSLFSSNFNLYVKGKRLGRPFKDFIFTLGMSIFESILFKKIMHDIGAQPNLFPRSFIEKINFSDIPNDFSIELFFYYQAKKLRYEIKKIPVIYKKRLFGKSSWNINLNQKIKFIKRTISFSFKLRKKYTGSKSFK